VVEANSTTQWGDDMLEGDELTYALEKVNAQLEEEESYWQQNNLPPAHSIYQMGQQQFLHHCHSQAYVELFKELGFTDDQLNLVFKQVVLHELQSLRKVAKEVRRQEIVNGVNVIRPGTDN
jgi:hypothetical protein